MRDIRNMASATERQTTVKTTDLLQELKANRKAHVDEYKSAVKGYLEEAKTRLEKEYIKATEELKKAFQRTKQELKRFDPTKASDTVIFCRSIQFELIAPRCYVDAYDQAIEMMKWETRETVELNTTEFRCFVMNKWDWMDDFKMSSSQYLK